MNYLSICDGLRKPVGSFFVTVLLDFCEAVDDMMCKYMEIIYESVLWAKKM
jgi:hypothetical protein